MIFTFGLIVSFGVIRFEHLGDKIRFKTQWLARHKEELLKQKVWLSDNMSKERRIMEVVAGKVKKAMI